MVKRASLLFLLFIVAPVHAALTAQLDKTEILEVGSALLTVVHQGGTGQASPDWSVLEKSFEYRVFNTISHMSVVNGRMNSYTTWEVQLQPKQHGVLTIPPITILNEQTRALTLRVIPLSDEVRQEFNRDAFIELDVSHDTQYVQAAIRVEQRFYRAASVSYARSGRGEGVLPIPNIDGARIMPVDSWTASETIRNGRVFGVLTQEYVIFPERSGELVIPAASVIAQFPATRTRTRSQFRVHGPEKTITVLPIPQQYPKDEPWLPASDLLTKQTLVPADLSALAIGDSFVRTLRITGNDTFAAGIPTIETEVPDGISVYADPPSRDDELTPQHVSGTLIQSETFIVTRPGTYNIAPTQITWWNTESHRVERASIDGFTVIVDSAMAGGVSDVSSSSEAATPQTPPSNSGDAGGVVGNPQSDAPPLDRLSYTYWLPAIGGWVIAALLAVFLGIRVIGTKVPKQRSAEIESIKRRLKGQEPEKIKQAMLDWVMARHNTSRAAATRLILEDVYLSTVFNELNDVLYGDSDTFKGIDVNKVMDALKSLEDEQEDPSGADVLLNQFT